MVHGFSLFYLHFFLLVFHTRYDERHKLFIKGPFTFENRRDFATRNRRIEMYFCLNLISLIVFTPVDRDVTFALTIVKVLQFPYEIIKQNRYGSL